MLHVHNAHEYTKWYVMPVALILWLQANWKEGYPYITQLSVNNEKTLGFMDDAI